MFLDAVDPTPARQLRTLNTKSLARFEENFGRWMEHPASHIVHHDDRCCEEARLWFLAFARSMEIGTSTQFELRAPSWLNQLFSWGPSRWPIAWCKLVREKVLDCGVFAALAREVFAAQGHQVHPAQALLVYDEISTGHWRQLWKAGEKTDPKIKRIEGDGDAEFFPWVGNRLVYHELCVIETRDGKGRFYDSTWGNWYEPHARLGYGSLLALRTECPRLLQWGEHTLSHGEWMEL